MVNRSARPGVEVRNVRVAHPHPKCVTVVLPSSGHSSLSGRSLSWLTTEVDETVRIDDGDTIRCPDCGMTRVVFSIEEEVAFPIHCIKCDEGIFIVGADHNSVMPRLVIDHATV